MKSLYHPHALFIVSLSLLYSIPILSMSGLKWYLNEKTGYYDKQLLHALLHNDATKAEQALHNGAHVMLSSYPFNPFELPYSKKQYFILEVLLRYCALHKEQYHKDQLVQRSLLLIFEKALKSDNRDTICLLLKYFPTLLKTTNEEKEGPFHWVVKGTNLIEENTSREQLVEALFQNNVPINAQDSSGNTPLHTAVTLIRGKNTALMVQLLLKLRADPCIKNTKGEYAYQTASKANQLRSPWKIAGQPEFDFKEQVVELLLSHYRQHRTIQHNNACNALSRLLASQELTVTNEQNQQSYTITLPQDITRLIAHHAFFSSKSN